jgi:hypothetical protein
MDCTIDFHDITHVVIRTGYAPSLQDMLSIEAAIREDTEMEVTALFGYETNWNLGLLVPCPFGFRLPRHKLLLPKPEVHAFMGQEVSDLLKSDSENYVAKINSAIDQMMAEATTRPFFEQARTTLEQHQQRYNDTYRQQLEDGPRVDLYEDLFEMVEEWTKVPLKPDMSMDSNDLDQELEIEDDDEAEAGHCCSAVGPYEQLGTDEILMSYNDRLQESLAVIEALGGPERVHGMLCFKVDPYFGSSALEMVDTLRRHELTYCFISNLMDIRCVEAKGRRILILHYDAEHG